MDQHFKQKRAAEEIIRLNIEIPRFITYMHDESRFLFRKEQEFAEMDPCLAYAIACYRQEQGRFHTVHMQRFEKLAYHRGFTGNIQPGVSIDRSRHVSNNPHDPEDLAEGVGSSIGITESAVSTTQEDDDADEEEEAADSMISNLEALCIVGA